MQIDPNSYYEKQSINDNISYSIKIGEQSFICTKYEFVHINVPEWIEVKEKGKNFFKVSINKPPLICFNNTTLQMKTQ